MKKIILIPILLIILGCSKKNSNAIIVGTSPDYPPFSYIENSKIVGFDIDLMEKISEKLNKNIEIRPMEFDLLLPELQSGNIQVVVGGMTATPQRCNRVDFSSPYLTQIDIVAVTNKKINKKISNSEELKKYKVIVNEGYVSDDFATSKGLKPIRVNSISDALFLLTVGQADVFITSLASLTPYIKNLAESYNIIDLEDDIKESCSITFSKKHFELANKIDKILKQMHKDGTIKELKNKWNFK